MYKICSLLLIISSPIYSALGPVLQCVKRLPGMMSMMHVADHQSNILMQQKRMLSGEVPLTEDIAQVKAESKKMDPIFLNKLKYKDIKLNGYSTQAERAAQFANKLRYIAAKAVFFGPSDDDMVTAVRSDEFELVQHLLSYGGNPHAVQEWGGKRVSVLNIAIGRKKAAIIGLLIDAGAYSCDSEGICGLDPTDIKRIFTSRGGSVTSSRTAVKNIIEREGAFSFNHLYFKNELTEGKRVEILKKIMLVVSGGAEIDFYFRTGGFDNGQAVCTFENDGSREMRFCDLKGDWTRGQFPELANYFTAMRILRNVQASVQQKQAAQAAIEGIMKKYGIQEDDVVLVPKVEAGSSRVQEAD